MPLHGRPPPLDRQYVNQWVNIASSACCAGAEVTPETTEAIEQASIVRSLDNLRTFPWIRDRVESSGLKLEGWWFDLEKGELWAYDAKCGQFGPVSV